MDNTNRQNIGLEQLLAGRLSVLSDTDDIPSDQLREQISLLSPGVMRTLDRMIWTTLRIVRGEHPPAYTLIPAGLTRLWSKEYTKDAADRIYAFLKWFTELRTANRRARTERLSRLGDICARMNCPESGRSAARTFFGLNNQRIILFPRGSGGKADLMLVSAEHEWGRAAFRFENCRGFDGNAERTLPLPGYLFSFDGSILPSGGFRITMLVDTSFGSENYPARLVSEKGWTECSFECDTISAEPIFYDYAGRMRRLGTPRAELISRCCALLVSKYELLGRDSLTTGERDMLPTAFLLHGSSRLLRKDASDTESHYKGLIVQALDNRYAMRRFSEQLERRGCEKLRRALELAVTSFDNDDISAAVTQAESLCGQLAVGTSNGSARPLLAELSGAFVETTASLPEDPYRGEAERRIIEKIKTAVIPELEKMGFTGNYPDYFRAGTRTTDHISFMLTTGGDKPRRGTVSYFVSIAAAQLTRGQDKTLEKRGLSAEKCRATDCIPEEIGLTRYGELAGMYDPEVIRMDMDMYEPGKLTYDDSHMLTRLLRIAGRQFERGTIPLSYRRTRKRAGQRTGKSLRSMADCSPLGIVSAAALLLFFYFRPDVRDMTALSGGQLVAASISVGFVITVLAAAIRNFFRSFRLWRY